MIYKRRVFNAVGHSAIIVNGIVLVLAGVLKLLDVGADDMVEGLNKANLIQHKTLISITAIVCGGLLFLPQTRTLGILMATAYWGGAIVAHLTYNDSPAMPSIFLGILWTGAFLCWNSSATTNACRQA